MANDKKSKTKDGYGYGYGYGDSNMFSVQESYKTVRTNIALSLMKDGCKKIVITSSNPSEGKSTVSMNIAISLAQAFHKVLLLDCDLRRPRDHKAFHVPSNPGITNIISGLATIDEAIQKTGYENLYFIPAGIVPPNPSEMLSGVRFEEMLKKLEHDFEYIIIDTPPVNVVSDTLSITPYADGVMYVVRSKYTLQGEVERGINALNFVKAKIIGFVLNDVDEESSGSYGRYGKYGKYKRYSYKYGYSSYSSPQKASNDAANSNDEDEK